MTSEQIGTFGYNALDIAEYIILYEDKQGHLMNNLKLQKILYFLQAEFIVAYNMTLFDEAIIAWDFGPVVKSVYFNYNIFGSASIFLNKSKCRRAYIEAEHKETINAILEQVRPYSSTQLVQICHNQAPWKNGYVRWNQVISPYELRDYFKEEEK